MLKEDHADRKGNDKFEGFNIDLVEEISKVLIAIIIYYVNYIPRVSTFHGNWCQYKE